MIDLQFGGFEEAIGRLHRAVAPVNDRRIGENAAAALEPVAEDARRLVQVDDGTLRASITVGAEFRGSGSDGQYAWVGPLSSGGTNAFYAHFLEFGTVKMRAYPFMAPAVHQNRELVFDILGEHIGKDIERSL